MVTVSLIDKLYELKKMLLIPFQNNINKTLSNFHLSEI